MVVRFGGQVDENGILHADILYGMEYEPRNPDKAAISVRQVDLIDHAFSWRVIARVIKHDLYGTSRYEQTVILLLVIDPSLDGARPDHGLIEIDERLAIQSPGRTEDFANFAPV